MLRTVMDASPFPDAWEDADTGLDFEDVGETEVSAELPAYEPSPGEEEDLPNGTIIGGRYTIEGVLGRGAMGVVYSAAHSGIGQRVALKYLNPAAAQNAGSVKRFFRESQIAALVKHRNIVEIFDGGRHGQSHFLVMERLEGRTLSQALTEGQLPLDEIIRVFLETMDGVAAVHERGVVHRDLKPDNVFLTIENGRPQGLGRPKVLDFGVSKLKQPDPSGKLTVTGMVMGTPHYMAPEQFADAGSVDAQADVYSLGIMLYEALTGTVPYDGEGVLSIYRQASEGRAAPIRHVRPGVPPPLEAVVRRAMQPEKRNRFASVQEMREALETAAAVGPSAAGWAPVQVGPTQAMISGTGDLPRIPSTRPTDPAPAPRTSRFPPALAPLNNIPRGVLYALAAGMGVGFFGCVALLLFLLLR
jgi:serine/threonine-protein kinase